MGIDQILDIAGKGYGIASGVSSLFGFGSSSASASSKRQYEYQRLLNEQ